jgi:hypothetical protein
MIHTGFGWFSRNDPVWIKDSRPELMIERGSGAISGTDPLWIMETTGYGATAGRGDQRSPVQAL